LVQPESGNIYRAGPLDQLSWLDHGFGTRLDSSWLEGAAVAAVRQVHSADVVSAECAGLLGEADALISNRPGLTLTVRTADCLPVLMADSRNRAIAAVHAGWRGVVREVVPRTIDAMRRHFDTRVADLTVAIGPGIGACCFEVGPEVAVQFSQLFPERTDLGGRVRIDLADALVRQLGQTGVSRRQIDTSNLCTCCRVELFHSYRRDRDAAGRMISGIRISGK
jgi:purine-nucleoside/S-methyl-5'-thioadenosine phosphorylase / adenosine deaminase